MKRVRCLLGAILAVLWAVPLGAQQPTGTIRGRISDAATQQPLTGVFATRAPHRPTRPATQKPLPLA